MRIRARNLLWGLLRNLLSVAVVAVITLTAPRGLAKAPEVVLQGFHWESYTYQEGGKPDGWYRILTSQADDFKSIGITTVWLPPPSASFVGDASKGWPHSRGYLPTEYYQLNTNYGTEEELRQLIRELEARGIRPIADIVLNHRHATGWSVTNGKSCQNLFFNPNWGPEVITKNDLSGCGTSPNYDTGRDNITFLDLDHLNQTVQNDLISWLKWLRWDVGFRGWRYDQVHGYGGNFVGIYNHESSPELSVGELWDGLDYGCSEGLCYNQDRHRQSIVNWIDSTWKHASLPPEDAAMAFDFTMRGILREAILNQEFWRLSDIQGRPPGVAGVWPAKAMSFIENHDTGSTQRLWPFSDEPAKIIQGYVYILTHPGVPSIFYDHLYYWGQEMRQQIIDVLKVRTRQMLHAQSSLRIERAERGLYVAYIDEKVVVKLGPVMWQPSGKVNLWNMTAFGKDYAIWERR